mmetsp:Transcript_28997/g.57713  ORF Transcript_28997/g.57713 Transcript_28997/m.57713 type:complete len:124 (-) Transcript_28997:135-506(-)
MSVQPHHKTARTACGGTWREAATDEQISSFAAPYLLSIPLLPPPQDSKFLVVPVQASPRGPGSAPLSEAGHFWCAAALCGGNVVLFDADAAARRDADGFRQHRRTGHTSRISDKRCSGTSSGS